MDHEVVRAYTKHMDPEKAGQQVKVRVPLRTGSHHTINLYERTSSGYQKAWDQKCSTQIRDLEVDAHIGDIIYQRTTSPAFGRALERYGVVLGDDRIDWGSDANWIVDFGPMGAVTFRGNQSPVLHEHRGRITAPNGEEIAGGAVPDAPSTSHGSG